MVYGIIYHTDKNWLNYLESNYNGGEVNFWSTRTDHMSAEDNIPLFFKTGGGKIVGMGELVRKEYLSVDKMWNKYGPMNGMDSKKELDEWFEKNVKGEKRPEVLCLILENFVIFRKDVDLSVIDAKRMQTDKYIRNSETVDKILSSAGAISVSGEEQGVNPDAVDPKFRKSFEKSRLFQGKLRDNALRYYGHKCLICGIDVDELLVVSHIKDVSLFPEDAGKTLNTLLLCKLHDGMFDRKLISVDNDNHIIIGDILKKSRSEKLQREVKELESTRIEMDLKQSDEFLKWHRAEMQRK